MITPLLVGERLTKHVGPGGRRRAVLEHVSLELEEGRVGVILGRSGSGKTTLLAVLGGVLAPDAGTVIFGNRSLWTTEPRARRQIIRREIGLVFQAAGLMPGLTASENVAFALELLGETGPDSRTRVAAALESVGLLARAGHRTDELSGGEQQRVALARALVKQPRLLLADEPTSQLDGETGELTMSLLREAALSGIGVLIATHDERFSEVADKVLELEDGRVLEPATG